MGTALENYYASLGNVVLRDSNGNPSIFVRHPKQKSNEFFDWLPDHTHPAFICGETEHNSRLIGKYKSCAIGQNSALYSLPNMSPFTNSTTTGDDAIARIRAGSSNTSVMTLADFGFLNLMGEKFNILLHGNNQYGADVLAETPDCKHYEKNHVYKVGDHCFFRGWEVECLKQHTSSNSLLPCDKPELWKYIRKRFATMDESTVTSDYPNGQLALTGSGPIDWYLDSDIRLEADLTGSIELLIPDFRIRNREIQIIPNNLAADPTIDISQSSSLWRAILPSQSDDSCTFVTPGTSGTLKYKWYPNSTSDAGDKHWELTAADIDDGNYSSASEDRSCHLNAITVDTLTVPYVPILLYELGLMPFPGKTYSDWFFIGSQKNSNDITNSKYAYYLNVFGNFVKINSYKFDRRAINNARNSGNIRPAAYEESPQSAQS